MSLTRYIIRGGVEGRERLRIISRVMRPTTLRLLRRAGLRPGMRCLEVGCGSGDLAFDLAQIAGHDGYVIATDIDEIKLQLARCEADTHQLTNLEFRRADVMDEMPEEFDFAHARFVLTHLANPERALENIWRALRPGGAVAVEDIDFRGHFCYPDCEAFRHYVELYIQTVQRRGADPNIGPRLPGLLVQAGFDAVQMNVVQMAAMAGEIKLTAPITMENIADAVIEEGLAGQAQIERLVEELYEFARHPGTIVSTPRVVESWGYRRDA